MRTVRCSLLLLLLGTFLAPSAGAGGWWSSIGLEGQPVGMGESIDLGVSEVMFDSIEEAEEAQGQEFFAYLVRDFDQAALDDAMTRADPGKWWRPTSQPIQVGTVELTDWDSNLAKGRVDLEVPEIEPGSYFLMLCDAGCGVPLGNLIPSGVTVTDDVVAAQTARRLQELEADLTLALQQSRSELRQTRSTLRQALSDDAKRDQRIAQLEAELVEAQDQEPVPWVAYAGWFFAGGATVFLLLRLRRSRGQKEEMLIERVPDDARELIDSR